MRDSDRRGSTTHGTNVRVFVPSSCVIRPRSSSAASCRWWQLLLSARGAVLRFFLSEWWLERTTP